MQNLLRSFENPVDLPFSLILGGRPSKEFLPSWTATWTATPGGKQGSFVSPDKTLQLTVELSEFPSTGVVEWLLRLKNTGAADAPVVEHLYPLNLRQNLGNKPAVPSVLHSSGCWDAGTG
ncbi:MAG: hypothetical protein WCG80_18190, partial [Spirochaetales bacterium]